MNGWPPASPLTKGGLSGGEKGAICAPLGRVGMLCTPKSVGRALHAKSVG